MNTPNLIDKFRQELAIKAKHGIDFIVAATILWLVITVIWTQDLNSAEKSVYTFMLSALMLPLAFLFSKIFKTQWTLKSNPLQPLGMWFNLAQLFYFPFLIFILIKSPDYFLMTYAIITGAHFFPYAWFYNTKAYAVMAGVSSLGSCIIAMNSNPAAMQVIGVFMVSCLTVLAFWLWISLQKKVKNQNSGS